MPPRPLRLAAVALLLLASAAYLLLREEQPDLVMVITIDTLRADAVGPQTPALREFLAEATHYIGARTVVPLTLPAHASLFSGLLPVAHGIHDNVTAPIPPRTARDFTLLAEEFRDAGYETAAFVARAVLAGRTGLAAGFDRYEAPEDESEGVGPGGYLGAEERLPAALAWLERPASGKRFVWVHLFDPHFPYRAYEGDARRRQTRPDDPDRARYHGEVRRADAAVERLLRAAGPDAVVLIASDHGEGLGEHGENTHGLLCYGTTIDAMLALRAPGVERGAIDREARSLCDAAPLLRAACSLPEQRSDTGAPVVLAESLYAWRTHGWGQVFAAFDGRYSLVESGPVVRLFDREEDPGEKRPLDPVGHPAYERLDRALSELRARGARGSAALELPEPSVAPYGRLRRPYSFYLPRPENARLANPERLQGLWTTMDDIVYLLGNDALRKNETRLRGLLQTLERLMQEAPESPLPHAYVADVATALGDLTGDVAWHRASAQSRRRSITLGFVLNEMFVLALRSAMAAADATEARNLILLARDRKLRPDAACRSALEEAARTLSLFTDPIVAEALATTLARTR